MLARPGTAEAGEVEVDGAAVADAFGVPAPFFMTEMRRGNVHGTVARGLGEDEGRLRLTFRYRGRRLVMVRQPDGSLVADAGSPGDEPASVVP